MKKGESPLPRVADLHTHTYYSDGELSPEDVVIHLAELGRSAIAITDHDSVDGIDEALETGRALGVEVIAGTELSTSYGGLPDLHILGYFIDHHYPAMCARLREFREVRYRRAAAIVERVNARLAMHQKPTLVFEQIAKPLKGSIGRPHIARDLVSRGLARTTDHAFREFLVPCNVPKQFFSPEEAFDLITRAGGVSVLAHPKMIPVSQRELEDLITTLQTMGLQGIEVYYGEEDPPFENFLRVLSRKHGLLPTGGSDFHGEHHLSLERHGTGLRTIPYGLFENLKAAAPSSSGP